MAARFVWCSDADFCRVERVDSEVASSAWVFSRLCGMRGKVVGNVRDVVFINNYGD